ncbi:hypothetical protein F9L33_02505 [Amylibacter sp. SFDW26]|uniref:MOSC domain-containing protein n=1 Tax=Amylibacter sp. SFDW26 TaxID=2652722 RepID=UPI001262A0C8|nr:hypothetical protein [Amylibacter sp. SFDW26]KAB7615652.1 hypothetical protein F9L33_02505 [Amylibacter sp. SFDW26]
MSQVTMDELQAAIPDILDAPKDNVPVQILCLRPDYGERQIVDQIELTKEFGIPSERWSTAAWMKLPDGKPDPRIQVSILNKRVMDLVWLDRENTPHPGDPIVADIDTSEANMPIGTILQIGTAVIRVTDAFNDACVKWKVRYGKDAKDWIVRPENIKHKLRGLLCEVVIDGLVSKGDMIRKA